MAFERKIIDNNLDDNSAVSHNYNYKTLFDQLGFISDAKKAIENFINGTGVVTNKMLEDKSVTTAKLNGLSVSTDKLGSRSVTNEKIADGAVNNYKLANKSVTLSKIDERAVDLTKFSEEVINYLNQKTQDDIKVSFELGGWNTGGNKVTTDSPFNVRSNIPIYLRKGMKVTQTPSAYYQYDLIERSTSVVGDNYYVDRVGFKTFGTDLTIKRNNFYYLVVRRTDEVIMTADDVTTVSSRFQNIMMDYAALVGIRHLKLELGGWNTGGNKVTTDSPINIRSASPIKMVKGDTIKPMYSSDYFYEFIVKSTNIPADDDYIERTGKISFGNTYAADRDGYYYLVVHNKNNRVMNTDDLNIVDRLLNNDSAVDRAYIINLLAEYGLTNDVVFELGGWWTGGNRTTCDQPTIISPTQQQPIKNGETLSFAASSKYEYELFVMIDGEFEKRTGYRSFGNDFISQGDYLLSINVKKTDGSIMTNTDISEVSKLFNGIRHSKKEDNSQMISKFSVVGDLSSYESHKLDYISNPNTIKAQEFNDMFNALAESHKDVVAQEKIGEDNFGNSLYSYEIKTKNMLKSPVWNTVPTESTGEALKTPKIIITSGIHGREKNANYAVYYFFKHLLENTENNTLNTILMNVHFVVMPLICPSGFEAVTYENKAGVNLNRDFPPYGKVTQPESIAVKSVIDSHQDADYHIDFHNHTAHDTVIGYSLTDDASMGRITTNAYKLIGRQWQIKQPELPQDRSYQWAYTSGANVGTVGRYTQSVLGIPSSIIETAVTNPWVSEGSNGSTITQMGVDLLSNVIIGILQARR